MFKKVLTMLGLSPRSGMAALGHKVPDFRKSVALRAIAKSESFAQTTPDDAKTLVEEMSEAISNRDSHTAIDLCSKTGVDNIECYRLMSILLTSMRDDILDMDRKAAVNALFPPDGKGWEPGSDGYMLRIRIECGYEDGHYMVQAFHKHRLETIRIISEL